MGAVVVTDLTKRYEHVEAIRGISFEVAPGEVFALLGPNGAGKTTTVEILEGYRARSGGSVEVLGFDPWDGGTPYRDRVGIVLQESGLEAAMTVSEALELYGGMYSNRRDTKELIELVGLEDKASERIRTLSGGQRRRLDLALGLVGDPDLIFLDEPTTGFDPSARRRAWELIKDLTSLGKTIILTTHYLDEAQYLADRIAVLSAGKIVAEGTPSELGANAGESTITFLLPGSVGRGDLPSLGSTVDVEGATVSISSADPTQDLHLLTNWAVDRGVSLEQIQVRRPTLEDVYLEIVDEGGNGQ